MRNAGIIVFPLLPVTLAHATTIKVPTDQPTVQDGINVASDFDTVLAESGNYIERVQIQYKKGIFLASVREADSTAKIKTGSGFGAITFGNAQDSLNTLRGFTIKNREYGIEVNSRCLIVEIE